MFNQATLVGNAGKDPELRYTASGTAIASFRWRPATASRSPTGHGRTKRPGITSSFLVRWPKERPAGFAKATPCW